LLAGYGSQNTDERQRGYLPLRHAALWTGVSVRTLRRWTNQGLPRYQAEQRGKVLIKLSDINAFLAKHRLSEPSLDVVISSVMKSLVSR
jgi:predicted site-specific integrase-resolvase